MSVQIKNTYICDGCGTSQDTQPDWARVSFSGMYESNAGLISTGPSRAYDYCHECWKVMRAAVKQRTNS